MPQTIGHIALVVRDYDEAIAFFTYALGFELIEDSVSTRPKRPAEAMGTGWHRRLAVEPICCWPKRLRRKRSGASAIKPVGAYFFFCIPTISGGITAP